MDALKPADILVALKLASHPSENPTVRQLGSELTLSKSAVACSIQRLVAHRIVRRESDRLRINRLTLRDLIENGLRWIAPAVINDFELGLPTAHSAAELQEKVVGDPDPFVIPLPHGPMRGRALSPLHPSAPKAAKRDPLLYRLLAIADMFRIGRARDRQIAAEALRSCL